MENSIEPFGIKINEWMDERRDFWKSTNAALKKLQENYDYFNDWAMALAAYNMGMGALRRICSQTGIRDYWSLAAKGYLKTETVHYVPKLLAVSYILSNRVRSGIDAAWPAETSWTRINLRRSVDLDLLARAVGIEPSVLIDANAELYYGVTPPSGDYFLKAPAGKAEEITAALARDDLDLLRYHYYTIRKGDTIGSLARTYQVTSNLILQSNPGLEANRLQVGVLIKIPAIRQAPADKPGETASFTGTHLVKRGETIWSISLAYNVDPETLAKTNNIALNDILPEGTVLKTPIK
jgi:membrane-bound lytic murein transglycosylase D